MEDLMDGSFQAAYEIQYSKMISFFIPFLTPLLLATGLYFAESLWVSTTRRCILLLLISASSHWTIYHGPYSVPILDFITGLGSAWYVIWSADLLFVLDPRTFRRIQISETTKDTKHHNESYHWEQLPGRLTLKRAFWVLDLVTNPRELGWEHGLHLQSIPHAIQGSGEKENHRSGSSPANIRRQSLASHIMKVVSAHFAMAMYERPPFDIRAFLFRHLPEGLQQDVWQYLSLLAWLMEIYFILTSMHSIIALIAVGIFGHRWLGTAGQPWMYPPIFGPARSFFKDWEIRAFWSKWWHNLLRRSLLSIPRKIIPACTPSRLIQRLLHASVSFSLSGYFHAMACYAVRHDIWSAGHVFLFFFLQPVPIAIQGFLSMVARRQPILHTTVLRCVISLTGICWFTWTFPVVLWSPAILEVQETFRVPWNIWGPVFNTIYSYVLP